MKVSSWAFKAHFVHMTSGCIHGTWVASGPCKCLHFHSKSTSNDMFQMRQKNCPQSLVPEANQATHTHPSRRRACYQQSSSQLNKERLRTRPWLVIMGQEKREERGEREREREREEPDKDA